MENMHINYYNLLEINNISNQTEILNAYQNKIKKFRNRNRYDNSEIFEIKLLKKGLYILTNQKLKLKYDNTIGLTNNIGPEASNNDSTDNLDSVFNIDNTWMDTHKLTANVKKNELNNIGDRIFSLSSLNKKPGYSTNDEINLRKPLQGRVEKEL
jgi:DnaJ-class molecular chaperone